MDRNSPLFTAKDEAVLEETFWFRDESYRAERFWREEYLKGVISYVYVISINLNKITLQVQESMPKIVFKLYWKT